MSTQSQCMFLWTNKKNISNVWSTKVPYLVPVVQSILSLTGLLVVKMFTILVSTISNSQLFLYPATQLWWGIIVSHWSSVCPSIVRPSVFCFRMITWVNINGFSPNLVCVLILWRSGLGLLMGKFRQFLTQLSARDTPIFSFPDYNLSK